MSTATIVVVGLAVGAGATGGVVAYSAVRDLDASVATILPTSAHAATLFSDVVDQETGLRGYEVTSERRFLQPYESGRTATAELLGSLQHALRGQPAERSDLDEVRTAYERWLTTWAVPRIAEVSAGHPGIAALAERSGRGKVLFDDVRRAFDRLQGSLAARASASAADARSLAWTTFWLMIAVAAAVVIGSLIGRRMLQGSVVEPIRRLEHDVSRAAQGELEGPVHAEGAAEVTSLGAGVEHLRTVVGLQRLEIAVQQSISSTLQRALLPATLPHAEDLEIATRYLPGEAGLELGGDWYNVRTVGPGQLFFAVGDVAGRGIAAATQMARLRFAIDAYAAEDPDPSSVLTRMSQLSDPLGAPRFATAICGVADARTGTCRLASAGHLPPLLVDGTSTSIVEVEVGPPLGVTAANYTSTELHLARGATLVAFTDGLIERRDEAIDQSLERARAVVGGGGSLEELVTSAVGRLLPEASLDDVVVVAVRRCP